MAPAKSDQNGSNQPAPPRQDQTDQGPTPWADYAEQPEQPMKQEVVMVIVTPAHSTITISDQIKADFEKAARLAQYQLLLDDNDDDFADEPLPRPYDPGSATVPDWAKSEVWMQEKDSEGNGYSRISFSINFKQDEHCSAINLRHLLDTRDQRAS
jgi:hypothetical protein